MRQSLTITVKRHLRVTKRTLIIAGLFAIVLGMVVWVAFQLRAREPQLSVTFLAYTNDATETRFATFVVSNLNSYVVRRQAAYWIELRTSTGVTNLAGCCWFSTANDFNPRTHEIIAVPVPTNQPSWRVLLSIRTDLGPVREMMQTVGVMIFGIYSTFGQRESYALRSDWMEK
jgi:hypothetical protein